jgi:hypothetical protein
VAVANACISAQSMDAVDALRAEYVRESAAALECADARISGAFASVAACQAAMKWATCPLAPPPVATTPLATQPPVVQVIERTTHEVRYLPTPVVTPQVAPVVAAKPKQVVKSAVKPPVQPCVVRPVCIK